MHLGKNQPNANQATSQHFTACLITSAGLLEGGCLQEYSAQNLLHTQQIFRSAAIISGTGFQTVFSKISLIHVDFFFLSL